MTTSDENEAVDESLGLFEAALKSVKMEIEPPEIETILLVPDASNQDETAEALAAAAAGILGAAVVRVDGLGALEDARDASDRILARADEVGAGLLVLPAPFAQNIGSLRQESLSAVVDVLIMEFTPALLLARQPVDDPNAALQSPVCVVDWKPELQRLAASWACGLARLGGRVDMVAAPDPSTLAEIRALLGDEEASRFTTALIDRAETRLAGSVVAAAQRAAAAHDFEVSFGVEQGRSIPEIVQERCGDDRLAVIAYQRERDTMSLHHTRNIVLAAQGPVLALGA